MIKLDFSNVEGGNFDPVPAGDYLVEIEKFEETTSTSGNQMIKATFKIVEGEYEGRKIFDNYVLNQNSLWKLKSLFVALGEDVSGMAEFSPDDFVGKKFLATVSIEESAGYDPTNRIKKHKKAPGVVLA